MRSDKPEPHLWSHNLMVVDHAQAAKSVNLWQDETTDSRNEGDMFWWLSNCKSVQPRITISARDVMEKRQENLPPKFSRMNSIESLDCVGCDAEYGT